MVFERPKRPGQQTLPDTAAQHPPASAKPKKVITVGGGNRSGGENGGGNSSGNGGDRRPPSPWLDPEHEPQPDEDTSFVEYLRWMRSPDSDCKDATKVQLLQIAEGKANYRDRLSQLTKRTELIAGKENTFLVKCPWRIRVGGHRGPESILLPAFDALGMPYIPSSTLRGVARCQAIRETMADREVDWKAADKRVAPYFGSLEVKELSDHAGKVIFLDAYPLPIQVRDLAMDMANNIWSWDGNSLKYSPNPNPFFSLKEPTFLIGLRLASSCADGEILNRVKQWLIAGLQSGIGSQVNTGYGKLVRAGAEKFSSEFFRVEFNLEGQLIHGCQKFTRWSWNDRRNEWQMRGLPDAEVRPIAFKSMLRYWFRLFALGVLDTDKIKTWEAKLFGAINPKQRGWVTVRILQGKVTQKEPQPTSHGKKERCGAQEGILTLDYSPEAPKTEAEQNAISQVFKNLSWLMFHLGGIGQGARRPCYSRQNRSAAPWYRGSTLIADGDDSFWGLPESPKQFQQLFQQRLRDFYTALAILEDFDYRLPKTVGSVSRDRWTEAIDANCRIIVCAGGKDFGKPYALAILHSPDFKIKHDRGEDYDGNLCGKVGKPSVKPSPVWIADLGDYQVVTVFGANQDPRKKYLKELRDSKSCQDYAQIWPLP